MTKKTHALIHTHIHTCMRKHAHRVHAYTMTGTKTHAATQSVAAGDTHKHRHRVIGKNTHTRTQTCERGTHTQDSHLPTLSQERGEKTTWVVATANGMTGHLTPIRTSQFPVYLLSKGTIPGTFETFCLYAVMGRIKIERQQSPIQ
jgi:hypothetical protein